MSQGSLIKKIICSIVFFSFFLAGAAARTEAASMSDYCVKPPFIVGSVPPNLLFMLDNSSSMYDLIYIDNGSTSPVRKGSYCYDNTFRSTNLYAGYFDQTKAYKYDLTNNYFYEYSSGIPGACTKRIASHLCVDYTTSGTTYTLTNFVASGKYLNWLTASKFDIQKKILTGGKYDTAQAMLLPETRGCLGRMFLKEAMTADFVDYAPANMDNNNDGRDDNDLNVSLGVTFSVRGPENANNKSAPSPGGQTYLNIYFGDYNQAICQTSIDAYSDPTSSNAAIKKAVNDCLSYTQAGGKCDLDNLTTCYVDSDCDNADGVCANITAPTCTGTPKRCDSGGKSGQRCGDAGDCQFSRCSNAGSTFGTVCGYITETSSWDNSVCNTTVGPCIVGTVTTESKTQVTFNQTIQACWAKDNGTPIGTDEANTVKNQCSDIYDELYTCDGGVNSGRTCTVATALTDCGADICVNGPAAVRPGNPALICSNTYAGMCYGDGTWNGSYIEGATTYTGNDCIIKLHETFCGDVTVPPVTDPTDDKDDTSTFLNLPAIISDVGVESQLNQPFRVLTVRIKDLAGTPEPPEGLLNDFAGTIRMGAMSFNFNGSASECTPIDSSVNMVCSNNFTTSCTKATEATVCGEGLCITPVPCPNRCSSDTNVTCATRYDCPDPDSAGTSCDPVGANNLDGAKVISNISDNNGSVGTHSTGLIKTIDDLKASSWTPFAEGFYNAIGYFARIDAYDDPDVPGKSRSSTLATDPSPIRINADDFDDNKNPSQFRCQDNNILIISDGQSTAENKNTAVTSLAALYSYADGDGDSKADTTGYKTNCPRYHGTMDLDDLAYLAKTRNIKSFSTTAASPKPSKLAASEQITTWVVYTGEDTPLTFLPDNVTPDECDPKVLMNETADNGGTTLYNPQDPDALADSLRDALNKIAAKTASGTAASVLASGEGSGANLIQALFYPQRRFNFTTDIKWIGVLQNLWYYIDPFLGLSSIREDSNTNQKLELDTDPSGDKILQFTFADNETKANLYADATGDGSIDSPGTPTVVDFEDIKSLWEAGKLLFSRAPGNDNTDSDARQIFTNLDGNAALDVFDTTAANETLRSKLNVSDTTEAVKLIKYIRGIDDVDGDGTFGADPVPPGQENVDKTDTIDGLVVRNRTVSIDLNGDNDTTDAGETGIWKLGDIVNATPKIVSWVPLNLYDKIYLDSTYKEFISTSDYRKRGMVYSGANDGMLHAFNLGLLGVYSGDTKATLGKACSTSTHTACRTAADCPGTTPTCDSDTTIGKELWAFIPKNALPYLKYLADPNYCHLYYIDSTPFIVDASINRVTDTNDDGVTNASDAVVTCTDANYWTCGKYKKSWRTILIGGMRLGGACRNSTSDCRDCTKTPIADTGYSTYFALDVTNPSAPTLLWELSNEALGYAMSGPAIVRIAGGTASNDNTDKNGRWYVVFGSGPSGYVSDGSDQFLGITEHNNYTFPLPLGGGRGDLRLFVYDLKSGELLKTINAATDLNAAFAGAMVNGAIDFDQDQTSSTGFYQDDAVYFGYTSRAALGSASTARDGDGASNTIRLADGSSDTAGFYNGQFIQRNDGGQETKLIIGYSGSGGATTYNATVDSNWKDGVPTAATTTYNIFPGWTDGGVLRLLTKQNLDPAQWVVSKVISGIGPVTSAVTKLQNYKDGKLRLFFGTGRYFYKIGDDVIDDASSLRKLYGIVEPCYDAGIKTACNTASTALSVTASDLGNAADEAGSTDAQGWYIELDGCANESNTIVPCSDTTAVFRPERLVTDPLAVTTGAVFFTTSSPTADPCEYGGQSHLWAVKYDTGGSLAGTGVLKGKAIVQVSTGSIEEVDLGTAFTERDNRRSAPMQGLPPSGGLSIVVPPKPIDKILHMRKH